MDPAAQPWAHWKVVTVSPAGSAEATAAAVQGADRLVAEVVVVTAAADVVVVGAEAAQTLVPAVSAATSFDLVFDP
jgi:hypothetical protein